jgi:hypothetical protein
MRHTSVTGRRWKTVAPGEKNDEAPPQMHVRELAAEASPADKGRGGETLRLLSDCRTYALDLDREEALSRPWQHAAKLMLEAAEGGSLEEVVPQIERILIHENKLVLGEYVRRRSG